MSNGTGAFFAAQNGHLELLKYLYQRGANMTAADFGGSTPLHESARKGQLLTAQWLMGLAEENPHGEKIDLFAKDQQGWTGERASLGFGSPPGIRVRVRVTIALLDLHQITPQRCDPPPTISGAVCYV